ncbi:AAA family ATPase [Paraburkholderia caffeinilytica]|uniref:AAA family ATPase n=1 Tax=Paraburkholderia caffeinilytica TaxID=1761016 RepID=UPI0038BBC965
MHIERFTINSHISERLGLETSRFKRLDRIIVLAGPNGSGKTRLLTALHWMLTQIERVGYESIEKSLRRAQDEESILRDPDQQPYTAAGVRANVEAIRRQFEPLTGVEIEFNENEDKIEAFRLYIDVARFISSDSISAEADLDAKLYVGVPRAHGRRSRNWLASSPLAYIEDISKRHARLKNSDEWQFGSQDPDPEIHDSFDDLASLLHEIAGLALSVDDIGGEPVVNGRTLTELSLSVGQRQLVRWIVLIHSRILVEASVPLLIDEPEVHLHPAALNKLFDALIERTPRAQIWVATHSLSLISHLAAKFPRSLWYANNGSFSSTAATIPDVVNGLAGGDGGPRELADFCGNVSEFAINSFAADCLVEPVTVKYAKDDPQVNQIFDQLKNISGMPISVLDFGAGQGRLIDGLTERCKQEGKVINDVIDYYAFEPMQGVRAICEQRVEAVFEKGGKRVFDSIENAAKTIGGKVDFIVLTNVLHEIPVSLWLPDIFSSNSLHDLLSDDGYMLIVEDTILPRGELAHGCGFIILEAEALRVMVGAPEIPTDMFVSSTVSKYQQRLQATLIAKKLLSNITHQSIVGALEAQRGFSLNAIRSLRSESSRPIYDSGRRHSFYAQLITNLMMAIEEMETGAEQS